MKRLLLVCTLLSAPAAIAQDEDRIAACETETDLERRIACLEAGLRGEPWPPEVATPQEGPTEPKVVAPQPTAPQTSVPQDVPVEMAEEPAPAASPPSGEDASALGQEQVEARSRTRAQDEAEEVRYTMRVESFRTVHYQRLELTMENGQVWRQISGDSQSIRIPGSKADNLEAEVWESRLGGYKLRLPDINRTIRVERLR